MTKSTIQFYIIFALLLLAIPISSNTVTEAGSFKPVSNDSIDLQGIGPDSFVSNWNTTKSGTGSSNSTQIKFPLESTGTYNFIVDWGDGTTDTITSYNQAEVTHTYYNTPGTYTVVVNGTLKGWRFNYGGDRLKIIEISQWGNINFGNLRDYFQG